MRPATLYANLLVSTEVLLGLRRSHPGHALLLLGVRPETALNERIRSLAGISDVHNLAPEMTVPRLVCSI